jgi:glyoxylase-like metal-dependent hydrolase (beta-lactamase superfamily II)
MVEDFTVHTFTRDSANVFVVVKGDRALMVDSGYEKNLEALDADVRAAGIKPETIRALVVTHGHSDHAGGAAGWHARYGTPIWAGRPDVPMLAKGQMDKLCPTGFLGRTRVDTDQVAVFPPTAVDEPVDAPVDLEEKVGFPGKVIPVPGHTAGTVVVLVGKSAFIGDLFRGSLVGNSAEVHLYMCDVAANRRDIQSFLKGPGADAEHFFVGHFGPVRRAAVEARFGGD